MDWNVPFPEKTIDVGGQPVTLRALSAAQAEALSREPDQGSVRFAAQVLRLSVVFETTPTVEQLLAMPRVYFDQMFATASELNGWTVKDAEKN